MDDKKPMAFPMDEKIPNIVKVMTEKEKYNYFVDLLEKIENSKTYKGDSIENDPELEKRRQKDLDQLNELISEHLINDGINKKMMRGRVLVPLRKDTDNKDKLDNMEFDADD